MPLDHVELHSPAPGRYVFRRPSSERAPLKIFAAASPEGFDMSAPHEVLSASELQLELTHSRPYFLLQDGDGGRKVLAERRLPLAGTPNFRDLGGYPGRDGRPVRWGKLFRSGRLSRLTPGDQQQVAGLALDLVFDFRHPQERAREPSIWAGTPPALEMLDVMPGNAEQWFARAAEASATAEDMAEFMAALNRELASSQHVHYRRLFQRMLDTPDARVLMHCSAGKDRTGFGVALLLTALGVPAEHIMADYLLTNACLPIEQELAAAVAYYAEARGIALRPEVLQPVFEVRPEYLHAALDQACAMAGDMKGYLRDFLGLGQPELAELARRYLA